MEDIKPNFTDLSTNAQQVASSATMSSSTPLPGFATLATPLATTGSGAEQLLVALQQQQQLQTLAQQQQSITQLLQQATNQQSILEQPQQTTTTINAGQLQPTPESGGGAITQGTTQIMPQLMVAGQPPALLGTPQQLLIPVSGSSLCSVGNTAGGIQQLITLPVQMAAAAAGGNSGSQQFQLLATPGGQLLAAPANLNLGNPLASAAWALQQSGTGVQAGTQIQLAQPQLQVSTTQSVPGQQQVSQTLPVQQLGNAAQILANTQQLQAQLQNQILAAVSQQLQNHIQQQATEQIQQTTQPSPQKQQQQQQQTVTNNQQPSSSSAANLMWQLQQMSTPEKKTPNTIHPASAGGSQGHSHRAPSVANLLASSGSGFDPDSPLKDVSSTEALATEDVKPATIDTSTLNMASGTDTASGDKSPTIAESTETIVDGVNLDKIKEFARVFKIRRLSLGLTQTQVGQLLSSTEGPAYSQSAICRFEKLDITPKSALRIMPVLQNWLEETEMRFAQQHGGQLPSMLSPDRIKKRKRRTSFTPQALESLVAFFEKNTHPSGSEMTHLANQLNYDREVIRVWFCNKRQALKNTIKKLKSDSGNQNGVATELLSGVDLAGLPFDNANSASYTCITPEQSSQVTSTQDLHALAGHTPQLPVVESGSAVGTLDSAVIGLNFPQTSVTTNGGGNGLLQDLASTVNTVAVGDLTHTPLTACSATAGDRVAMTTAAAGDQLSGLGLNSTPQPGSFVLPVTTEKAPELQPGDSSLGMTTPTNIKTHTRDVTVNADQDLLNVKNNNSSLITTSSGTPQDPVLSIVSQVVTSISQTVTTSSDNGSTID